MPARGPHQHQSTHASPPRRCVVLVPAGRPLPAPLLAGLKKRGMAVRIAGDAPAVMAELALHSGGGGGFGGGAVVIIHQPQELPAAQELRRAIVKHYPASVIWQSVSDIAGQSSRLTRFEANIQRVPRSTPRPETPPASPSPSPITPPDMPPEILPAKPATQSRRDLDRDGVRTEKHCEPLVSPEEMAMLLGGDFSSRRNGNDDGL